MWRPPLTYAGAPKKERREGGDCPSSGWGLATAEFQNQPSLAARNSEWRLQERDRQPSENSGWPMSRLMLDSPFRRRTGHGASFQSLNDEGVSI